jgi:hypothetical protein
LNFFALEVRRSGGGPEDFDFLFDGGEVLVPCGECGFAVGGEGGGEAVGVGEFVVGAEFGGGAGQVESGVDEFDGELAYIFEDFAGDAGAVGATRGGVDFAPVDYGHEELAFAGNAEMEEFLDLAGAGANFEEGDERAGV